MYVLYGQGNIIKYIQIIVIKRGLEQLFTFSFLNIDFEEEEMKCSRQKYFDTQ